MEHPSTQNPTCYLIRHATPDWERKDIRYDVPPGPPLTEKGEMEASQLAKYLQTSDVKHLYTSPMQRALRTAEIVNKITLIPYDIRPELTEWRCDESETEVINRIWPFWESQVKNIQRSGAIAIISHGGPITLILKAIKMDPEELDQYCHSFDGNNPVPPAGAWKISKANGNNHWDYRLVFKPGAEE